MAPAPVLIGNDVIRIYVGGWDESGISRIWYIDVAANNPDRVLRISDRPVLDLGVAGAFDDNGVFPGHAYKHEGKYYLYYTGFQVGHRVRYFNFGGLAVSDNGEHFERASQAPVLDRADEGLTVRAGQSIIWDRDKFKSCYSAGSSWLHVGGETRPIYDVYCQESSSVADWGKKGRKIVECDLAVEHGLGRPQLVKVQDKYYVFYTRRTLDMRYHMGAAISTDCVSWKRIDDQVSVQHTHKGFDDEMVYFPAVVENKGRLGLFYSGNAFGGGGLGFAYLDTI
jgi:sucrose-6-phosphate hydrolase SacC (GH32 family)